MRYRFEEMFVWVIICITVAYTTTQFTNCNHTRIEIICDAKQDECKKVLTENAAK